MVQRQIKKYLSMTFFSMELRCLFTVCPLDTYTAKIVDFSNRHYPQLAPDRLRGIVLVKASDGWLMAFCADDNSKY